MNTLGPNFAAVQRDWENREFINNVQTGMLKLVQFINKFGIFLCFSFRMV